MKTKKPIYVLLLLFVYSITYSAAYSAVKIAHLQQVQPIEAGESLLQMAMGPFGALAISLVGLYVTYRVIMTLQRRNQEYLEKIDELQHKLLEEKDRQLKQKNEFIEKLITQMP